MKLTASIIRNFLLTLPNITAERVDDFMIYHKSNPLAWENFEIVALIAKNKGKVIGANAVRERARYEIERKTGQEFNFNNNYTPLYARIFNYKHQLNYFEFRDLKAKDAPIDYDYLSKNPKAVEQKRKENLQQFLNLPSTNEHFYKRRAA